MTSWTLPQRCGRKLWRFWGTLSTVHFLNLPQSSMMVSWEPFSSLVLLEGLIGLGLVLIQKPGGYSYRPTPARVSFSLRRQTLAGLIFAMFVVGGRD